MIDPGLELTGRWKEKRKAVTAQPVDLQRSREGSKGGRSIARQSLPGADVLMKAPRPHRDGPLQISRGQLGIGRLQANNRRQAAEKAERKARRMETHIALKAEHKRQRAALKEALRVFAEEAGEYSIRLAREQRAPVLF